MLGIHDDGRTTERWQDYSKKAGLHKYGRNTVIFWKQDSCLAFQTST